MSRALPLVLSAALLACIAVGLRAQATASRPSASTAATVKAAQQFLAFLDPSQTPKASYAFGDATLTIPRFPVRILPASGYLQAVAYECVDAEALSRVSPPPR